jgi:hypothetical protein
LSRLNLETLQLPEIDIVGEDEIMDVNDLLANVILRLRNLENLRVTDKDEELTDYHASALFNITTLRSVRMDGVANVMGEFVRQLPLNRSKFEIQLKVTDFCYHADDLIGLRVPEFLKLNVLF